MLAGEAFSRSVAVAPKRSGKIADEYVFGGHPENFLGIAVGDDE
jgi:hypothetical protein